MARAKDTITPASDVLVYLDQDGGVGCCWYKASQGEGKRAAIPILVRHLINPRLHIVPVAVWSEVQKSGGWTEAAAEDRIRPIAGQSGDLKGEWSGSRDGPLVRMIEKSNGVEVLQRLQVIESESEQPRLAVSEALEMRLDELRLLVEKLRRKRDGQRRANRRRRRAA